MSQEILTVSGLRTQFPVGKGAVVKAVDDVSFGVREGEILGLIGETGSGKSVTALSIMRLIPSPGRIVGGKVLFRGQDLLQKSESDMRKVRGREISMVFQNPSGSLNPVFTIGSQIEEAIRIHKDVGKDEVVDEVIKTLSLTGLPDPEQVAKKYPHELSGGMKQRAMIAMAVSCNPSLLIADEPTTALDVTTQAQVLRLLKDVSRKLSVSMILISHNFGVISELCDRVAVMYAGTLVELADILTIYERPAHPYTIGLIKSVPKFEDRSERFSSIRGSIPSPVNLPSGCVFNPRCDFVKDDCRAKVPELIEVEKGHFVSCLHWREVLG